MKAMALMTRGAGRVELVDREIPAVLPGDVLVRVRACGVCRTDLHIVDDELPGVSPPVVPGHEIVGVIERIGDGVEGFTIGDRVGVPWLGYSCGACEHCRTDHENLCASAQFTGYQIDGGYADYTVADARYTFRVPDAYGDAEAAPLLCAGLIGYRAYGFAGDARRLGIYGFGAAAHIVAQIAVYEGRDVFAFTSPRDDRAQVFARELGAKWAGSSTEAPPEPLDAAIIFAPVGSLVVRALEAVAPGGVVICAGIHMSDIPSFPYSLLWGERVVRSVANLTRRDARDFLALAPKVPVKTRVTTYPLFDANLALEDLRGGKLIGAAVVVP